MTPRERFIHFIATFAPAPLRDQLIDEALHFDDQFLAAEHVDDQGDRVPPVTERPMESAWEYVQYRKNGVPRPLWFPRVVPPTPIRLI